jgi:hypothetical protein
MDEYKINRPEEIRNFVATQSYHHLLEVFQELSNGNGHIIHVMGAPGTGKSINIYSAIKELELNVYEIKLILPFSDINSKDVFRLMMESIREDLKLSPSEDILSYLGKFDAVLFADQFHDSQLIFEDKVGFSQWTDYKGFQSLNFYLICIYKYLKHKNGFKDINMVLQTAWRVRRGGKKKDLFTDMGIVSLLAKTMVDVPFEVVEISYSEEETINIVKSHLTDADVDTIKKYMKRYGNKPRFICQALKTGR